MSTEDLTVLAAAVLAAVVAIAVPWLAFRYALRQEHARWLREQRSVLYADMLVTGRQCDSAKVTNDDHPPAKQGPPQLTP
ncbi:hypothetical protein [Streptomyces sp. NPDC002952]|uniref:hypothetical protein n=1 Tax=Streptomyces sp. NPDC002952 TaxID=3364673 RepID=UPI003690A6A5